MTTYHQLNLFDMPDQEVRPPTFSPPVPNLTDKDGVAMRSWLLVWGEHHHYPGFGFPFDYPAAYQRGHQGDRRYGGITAGKQGWMTDTQPPYNQREHYPGEWLVKAIEHVKRFESGECSIPWQISQRGKSKETRDWEEEG